MEMSGVQIITISLNSVKKSTHKMCIKHKRWNLMYFTTMYFSKPIRAMKMKLAQILLYFSIIWDESRHDMCINHNFFSHIKNLLYFSTMYFSKYTRAMEVRLVQWRSILTIFLNFLKKSGYEKGIICDYLRKSWTWRTLHPTWCGGPWQCWGCASGWTATF